MTRVWTRRSAPVRRRSRSAGTVTSRRRRSLPRRVMSIPVVASLLDLEGAEANAIRAVVGSFGDLEPLAFAARPEADVDHVGPGGGGHEGDVRLGVIAHVLA